MDSLWVCEPVPVELHHRVGAAQVACLQGQVTQDCIVRHLLADTWTIVPALELHDAATSQVCKNGWHEMQDNRSCCWKECYVSDPLPPLCIQDIQDEGR